MARTTTQKAILKPDAGNTTDTIKNSIVKSRKRVSLDEFAIVNGLRPEIKAGFKVWLKGQYFHFEDEWKKLFEDYNNR